MTHELFDVLYSFCPAWQTRYGTLLEAATAAHALPEYNAFMATEEGTQRRIRLAGVPDTVRANAVEQRSRKRMLKIAMRSDLADEELE